MRDKRLKEMVRHPGASKGRKPLTFLLLMGPGGGMVFSEPCGSWSSGGEVLGRGYGPRETLPDPRVSGDGMGK